MISSFFISVFLFFSSSFDYELLPYYLASLFEKRTNILLLKYYNFILIHTKFHKKIIAKINLSLLPIFPLVLQLAISHLFVLFSEPPEPFQYDHILGHSLGLVPVGFHSVIVFVVLGQ